MRKHLGSRTRQQAREQGERLLAALNTASKAYRPQADPYKGLPQLGLKYGLGAHTRDVLGTRKYRSDRRRLSVADQLRIQRDIMHAAALVEDAKRSRPQEVNRLRRVR